ncbi:MAG TPA: hypothetical protein VN685_13315 [Rhizomicrobium sp.]|nr:hypothetical protein [Rhizomicrobium sp.]
MLDDASLGFLGMPFIETIMVVLGLALCLIAARASIHALNSLSRSIRQTRPGRPEDPTADGGWLMARIVVGISRLDLTNDGSRALLSAARRRMMLCGVLFAAIIAGMIWFSART